MMIFVYVHITATGTIRLTVKTGEVLSMDMTDVLPLE
jgi:hypothetical protein